MFRPRLPALPPARAKAQTARAPQVEPSKSLRARIFLVGLCVIAAMGAVFGAAAGAALIRPPHVGAALGGLSGAIDFASIAALIGGAETFLLRAGPVDPER